MPLAKWREIEANALREAMQKVEGHPDDPEAVMELHGTMVECHRIEEALKLAEVMAADFPDHVGLQMYLGYFYGKEGREEKAKAHFDRAFQLNPEDLSVRRMVALACIEQGDFARARQLLVGSDVPGPHQAPTIMQALAEAYQAVGDHQNALDVYQTILQMVPASGEDSSFRWKVQRSEKSLGRTASILPKPRFRFKKWHLGVAAALLIAAGFFAFNFYKTYHQSLYIVSQIDAPLHVNIDGQTECDVPNLNHVVIEVSEGAHRAVIKQAGQPDEIIDFSVENKLIERLKGDSVFVLNPSGAGTILWEERIYYPENNLPKNPVPDPYRLFHSEKFFTFRDIDYAFQQAPRTMPMKKHQKALSKFVLSVFPYDPITALNSFPLETSAQEKLTFVETHLKRFPESVPLLQCYFSSSVQTNQIEKGRNFLLAGLNEKPVNIEWHRMYQKFETLLGHQAELEIRYQKMLDADPDNSALLLLCGMIEIDPKQAQSYIERARKADPKNAYVLYYLAFRAAGNGDYVNAKELVQDACRNRPDHEDMEDLLFQTCFALKEFAFLKENLLQSKIAKPIHLQTQLRLLQVLVATGFIEEAIQVQKEYVDRVNQYDPTDSFQLILQSQLMFQYLNKDFSGMIGSAAGLKDPLNNSFNFFIAYLESGNPHDAEAALERLGGQNSSSEAFLLSLAWDRQGNRAKAEQWRKMAIELCRKGGPDYLLAAKIMSTIQAGNRIDLAELDNVNLSINTKAIWITALAGMSEDQRKELLEYAKKLNIKPVFPYHFLNRIIDEKS